MQSTSQTWRDLFAAGAALETRATIGGTVYADISAPVVNRALMQDRLSVGNVVSASLALAVRGAGSIPRSAAVVVETRLNDGVTASEWLPQGTFYISRRMRDPVTGVLALECYDALLKANALWTPSAGTWPRTMAAVVAELAALLGVSLDSRTVIPSGAAFVVSEPAAGTTIRDALSVVAQAAGGNWIMTPANRLRLVRLGEVGGAVAVAGVVGGIEAAPAGAVTGVRSTVDGLVTLIGDDTGIVVDVTIAPVIAADMADALIGLSYQPYSLAGAIYDPAAELGDGVSAGAGGEVSSALCSEQATLGPAFRGDIAAPAPGEVTDEYPYIGGAERTLALAKAAVAEAVEAFDDTLTQQEIFNRLTDDGAAQGLVLYNGQLYINAYYVNAGYLSADRIAANSIAVGKLTGTISGGLNNTWVLDLTNGTFTIGNMSADKITTGMLTADRINLNSYTPGIQIPDEYDASTLLNGQSISDGWIVSNSDNNPVFYIANAVPWRGKRLSYTFTSYAEPAGGSYSVTTATGGYGGGWPAPPPGAVDEKGELWGYVKNGNDYIYTGGYTVPNDAVSVTLSATRAKIRAITVDSDISNALNMRYSSNVNLSAKGLQVGKFVVDKTGNVTFNGDVSGNVVKKTGDTMTGSLFVNTPNDDNRHHLGVSSPAGRIFFYVDGTSNGYKGIWVTNSNGSGKYAISVDSSNDVTLNGHALSDLPLTGGTLTGDTYVGTTNDTVTKRMGARSKAGTLYFSVEGTTTGTRSIWSISNAGNYKEVLRVDQSNNVTLYGNALGTAANVTGVVQVDHGGTGGNGLVYKGKKTASDPLSEIHESGYWGYLNNNLPSDKPADAPNMNCLVINYHIPVISTDYQIYITFQSGVGARYERRYYGSWSGWKKVTYT